jgi:hypothetical protein
MGVLLLLIVVFVVVVEFGRHVLASQVYHSSSFQGVISFKCLSELDHLVSELSSKQVCLNSSLRSIRKECFLLYLFAFLMMVWVEIFSEKEITFDYLH